MQHRKVYILLFQSLETEYVHSHSCCNGNENGAHPPLLGNEDGTIEQCCPHHCHRDNLHTQGQRLVLPEVPDICAQMLVGHEPVIQPLRTTHVHCRREQQEWRSWQHRQKNTHNAQHKRHATQKCKKELHCLHLPVRRYKKYPTGRNVSNKCTYFSLEKCLLFIFYLYIAHDKRNIV